MKTYFPFGPAIGHAKLPDELVSDLNKDCDDIVKDKELSKSHDWSHQLVGEVEQELLIQSDIVNKWGNWFGKQVREYVAAYFEQLGIPEQNIFTLKKGKDGAPLPITKTDAQQATNGITLNVQSAWYIRSFAGDYNPIHTHGNCELTCVGFLKVPDFIGEQKNEGGHNNDGLRRNNNDGVLEIIGSAGYNDFTYFENDRIGFTPKVGNWYLFPATLRHAVYPFRSDGERRSFSINMSTNMIKSPSEK